MAATREKKTSLEVSSDQITSELIEIKDRLAALETIASLSNRQVVESYAKETLKSAQSKKIMRLCEQPQTKETIRVALNFASTQALDNHLKPLREDDLLQQSRNSEGLLTFSWSNLFRRLPKKDRERILK